MINNAAFTPVGILGLGFLGQILAHEFSTVPESWGTWHKTQLKETPIPVFLFDWANGNNWSALPETPVTLVLTIPPLLKNSKFALLMVSTESVHRSFAESMKVNGEEKLMFGMLEMIKDLGGLVGFQESTQINQNNSSVNIRA